MFPFNYWPNLVFGASVLKLDKVMTSNGTDRKMDDVIVVSDFKGKEKS